MKEVSLRRLAEYFNLENLTPSISLDGIYIEHEEINGQRCSWRVSINISTTKGFSW